MSRGSGRNNVVWILDAACRPLRWAGCRIVDLGYPGVPRVWAQQLTEITLSHSQSGDSLCLRVGKPVTDPFFIHKPEQLLSKRIHRMNSWNPYRTTDSKAEVVVT